MAANSSAPLLWIHLTYWWRRLTGAHTQAMPMPGDTTTMVSPFGLSWRGWPAVKRRRDGQFAITLSPLLAPHLPPLGLSLAAGWLCWAEQRARPISRSFLLCCTRACLSGAAQATHTHTQTFFHILPRPPLVRVTFNVSKAVRTKQQQQQQQQTPQCQQPVAVNLYSPPDWLASWLLLMRSINDRVCLHLLLALCLRASWCTVLRSAA